MRTLQHLSARRSAFVCALLLATITVDGFQSFRAPLASSTIRSARATPLSSRPRVRGGAQSNGSIQMVASPRIESEEPSESIVEGPFEGEFGTWFVYKHDAAEVLTYRASLLVAALSVASGAALASFPSLLSTPPPPAWSFDVCAGLFLASFGVSLSTIHIYMKPLHNMLKVLWASGVVGALAVIAADPSHSLVLSTVQHPVQLLGSGWVFVALTGLFFKEFACFQRWEASALFALVPIITGGHFLGLLDSGAEGAMLDALALVFSFFALRKFSQPLKADIGDKTVFEFLAQREAEAEAEAAAQQT